MTRWHGTKLLAAAVGALVLVAIVALAGGML